jgi:alcohol dehydrogenase (NADP+)
MADSAPRTIKAYAAFEAGLTVKPYEYTSRVLGDDDVEIAISHCGICGSDLHTISGGWGDANWPVVPGHEIVGTVTKRGASVTELALGDRVGVGAMVLACLDKATCSACASDCDPLCKECVHTYNDVYNDGEKSYGGYAEHVRVSSKYAFKIPDAIPSDLAAPLLCAGVTVYTPLKEYVQPGMRVGVVGIGGLGHLGVQFAKALGATPVAFSHSANKEQEARGLGAEDFVVLGDTAQVNKAAKSVDVLLVTANGKNQPFDTYISFVKIGGKVVLVGAPEDNIVIAPFSLIGSKVSVLGSNIGGIKDTKDMLELAAAKGVRPIIQKLPMSEANAGIKQVEQCKARFRVVLEN